MRILGKIQQEPTIFLFRKMWKFSKDKKSHVLTYIILSALATTTALMEPLLFAGFINEIQNNGITADVPGESWNTSFADLDLKTMLVPQEPEIFSSTIRENITLGVNYAETEIKKVMKLAEFANTVKQLPRGLDSVINEKGVNLSGGQKQRLALARALLFAQDKELILLDESTSSVDPENEVKIYQNIFKHFKGKTVLASIHKMNLLKYFDRIVIFADGRVVDTGTFEELLKKNAEFAQSWEEYTKSHQT